MKQLNIRLSEDAKTAFHLACIEKGITMQDYIVQCIKDFISAERKDSR